MLELKDNLKKRNKIMICQMLTRKMVGWMPPPRYQSAVGIFLYFFAPLHYAKKSLKFLLRLHLGSGIQSFRLAIKNNANIEKFKLVTNITVLLSFQFKQ